MVLEECNCDVNRGGQRILWPRGPRDIVCSGNMGAKVLIRTANGALFWGVSGACSSGKIFEIEVL